MGFDILNILRFLAVDITGNVQVKLLGFNLSNRHHSTVFFYFNLFIEYIYNLVNILLTQAVFVTVFYKTFRGVDHKDAFAVVGVFLIQHNNAGRDTGAIKKIRRQPNDAFNVSPVNNIFADLGLVMSAKQHPMWQNHRTLTFTFQRADDVQKKSIITVLFGRDAVIPKTAIYIVCCIHTITPGFV